MDLLLHRGREHSNGPSQVFDVDTIRARCWADPDGILDWGRHQSDALRVAAADGVCVARAEQAVGAQAVYSARRHFDKVEALSVVATVDDVVAHDVRKREKVKSKGLRRGECCGIGYMCRWTVHKRVLNGEQCLQAVRNTRIVCNTPSAPYERGDRSVPFRRPNSVPLFPYSRQFCATQDMLRIR